MHARSHSPRRPNVTSSIKPEVHNSATPPEEDRATATGDLHKEFREDRSSGSRDMLADGQTETDRNTPLPYWGRVKIIVMHQQSLTLYFTFMSQLHCYCPIVGVYNMVCHMSTSMEEHHAVTQVKNPRRLHTVTVLQVHYTVCWLSNIHQFRSRVISTISCEMKFDVFVYFTQTSM